MLFSAVVPRGTPRYNPESEKPLRQSQRKLRGGNPDDFK